MSLPVHLRPSSEQTQRASVGGIFGGIFRKRNFLALLNQSLAEIVGLPFGHHIAFSAQFSWAFLCPEPLPCLPGQR
jgi:hypothetical protein